MLCKKAAFLGKLALFVTGLMGYGSALSLGGLLGGGGGVGGGFGGFGGGFGGGIPPLAPGIGGIGGGFRPPFLNDVNVNVNADSPGGYYKYGNYGDEQHRQEKKLTFQTPSTSTVAPNGDVLVDTFYDFEKKVLMQDRHLPPDVYGHDDMAQETTNGYRSFVWKET